MRSNIRGSRAVHILQGQGLIKAEVTKPLYFHAYAYHWKVPSHRLFYRAMHHYTNSLIITTLEGRERKVEARGGPPDCVTGAEDLAFIGFKI